MCPLFCTSWLADWALMVPPSILPRPLLTFLLGKRAVPLWSLLTFPLGKAAFLPRQLLSFLPGKQAVPPRQLLIFLQVKEAILPRPPLLFPLGKGMVIFQVGQTGNQPRSGRQSYRHRVPQAFHSNSTASQAGTGEGNTTPTSLKGSPKGLLMKNLTLSGSLTYPTNL